MDFTKLARDATADQASENIARIAGFMSDYYHALTKEKLPDKLIAELVISYSMCFWNSVFAASRKDNGNA